MAHWQTNLKHDPRPALLDVKSEAIRFFTKRDLLGEPAGSTRGLWDLPEAARLIQTQRADGAWQYPTPRMPIRSRDNYNLLETYRVLGFLVEKYGVDRRHDALRRAARYIFNHQSAAGDLRGIYGNQLSPNYTAGFLELLTKAGLSAAPQVERGFRWLLEVRQADAGWAIPFRTVGKRFDARTLRSRTIAPERSRPSSHLVTGVVLRAFAAHPRYRWSAAARSAGALLVKRLFKPDSYPDRRAAGYWTAFTYPYWFTDLLSALDALAKIGFSNHEQGISRAVEWFRQRQHADGLWRLRTLKMVREPERDAWLSLAICRVFVRLFDPVAVRAA